MCPSVYEQDINKVCNKLDRNEDGRVGYVRWIKAILKKQRKKTNHFSRDSVIEKPVSKEKLAMKIAAILGIQSLSVLRASLLKCDIDKKGLVSIVQFRAALRGTGVPLQDRDLRKLVAAYLKPNSRLVYYRNFLKDAFSYL